MPTPQAIGLDDWKAQAKEGKAPSECLLRKGFAFDEVVKLEDGADGLLRARFVISMGTVDRDDDTVDINGWDVNDWLKNPQVLWAHDYYGTAVSSPEGIGLTTLGLGEGLTFTDGRMESVVAFQPRELNPLAHTIAQLVLHARRFIRAASVGFKPLKYAFNEDRERFGVDFLKQLLLEWSICPIGSHPDTLSEAKSLGIELAGLKEWAEAVLDGCDGPGRWLPKSQVEAAYKLVAGGKAISIPALAIAGTDPDEVRSVLAGDIQLVAADGTVLRTLVPRPADDKVGTEAGAGAADAAAEGAEQPAEQSSAAAADAPAGETATAAAPTLEVTTDGTITASSDPAKTLEATLATPEGARALETFLAARGVTLAAPGAAPAPAGEQRIGVDPAVLRQAAKEIINETFAPIQGALTSATGHLG